MAQIKIDDVWHNVIDIHTESDGKIISFMIPKDDGEHRHLVLITNETSFLDFLKFIGRLAAGALIGGATLGPIGGLIGGGAGAASYFSELKDIGYYEIEAGAKSPLVYGILTTSDPNYRA